MLLLLLLLVLYCRKRLIRRCLIRFVSLLYFSESDIVAILLLFLLLVFEKNRPRPGYVSPWLAACISFATAPHVARSRFFCDTDTIFQLSCCLLPVCLFRLVVSRVVVCDLALYCLAFLIILPSYRTWSCPVVPCLSLCFLRVLLSYIFVSSLTSRSLVCITLSNPTLSYPILSYVRLSCLASRRIF